MARGNMWHSNEEPYDDWETEGEYQARTSYAGYPTWSQCPRTHGFKAHFPTAAEDFATPYVEDGEDPDGWDLI